ncbi:hypothetical protein [Lunatibacter salilacus]|uniref:hypothetical protein n=1 Tax=Lunatibacter salilacus TaxID=2483804 RepID=UPI00131A8A86|nr:hypothetical protein [Lunatibacter salilacus]
MKKFIKTFRFVLLFGIFSLIAKPQEAVPAWTNTYQQNGINMIPLFGASEVFITIGDTDLSFHPL